MVLLGRLCVLAVAACLTTFARAESVDGIRGLANRILNGHGDAFDFVLTTQNEPWSRWKIPDNDNYTVKSYDNGKIRIEGTTLSALSRGLRHYMTDTLQLDDYWFVERYKQVPESLPWPKHTLEGASIVPWRYNLNTVTFSYTFAWYSWDDWEKLLDWAALRGINLHLAWVGYEKVFLESFRDMGMTDDEFDLQKKIVARMVELGITPILPAFTGFVPEAFKRVRPQANVTQASNWGVPNAYTRDTFLSPLDDAFTELQHMFITKQMDAFGNITNIYTLDQYNEMSPASGDVNYLSGVSTSTYKALSAANPAAIWLLQGWLFYNEQSFWTQERIDAYLSGAEGRDSMLILDLYSENQPQWQRTNSYSGRPWIWCELHDFGGNMGLFGQITNITVNSVEALQDSDSLAWSSTSIDTKQYFREWTTLRYAGALAIPTSLYDALEILRATVYDVADPDVPCVGVGLFQIFPGLTGLLNRTGHFPAPTAIPYDPKALVKAWSLMFEAAKKELSLWQVPAFQLDFVDVTRQVMSNAFIDIYSDLVQTYNNTMSGFAEPNKKAFSSQVRNVVSEKGKRLLEFLSAIDLVLSTNSHFTLDHWLSAAQYWANAIGSDNLIAFNARSQVTVWQIDSPSLDDYAAKEWSGLTQSYYRERWAIFVDALEKATRTGSLNETAMNADISAFEKSWQYEGFSTSGQSRLPVAHLEDIVHKVQRDWPAVFSVKDRVNI
ncbi:alpha-N-acetylglucosaminidase [Penicillium riverlandense]|uniref:alpha-N-acetylglucosaminidase n=1 Tax=Penicillium riverlandense TaxID=1903569 RepID=UPI002547B144|nr:alpha-N-acetylglucosaminidase [Penicillium riverlandense]KAJ5820619.1 alpha-N-acetylglucosaminidase [Penicillium riverlandense]